MELVIRGLSKTYPNGVQALSDVSLTIPTGMFGLLGPNGAGKSTLMRTIATLQQPDAGEVRLGDLDVLAQPAEVRKLLGYLPQEFGLYPNMSARDDCSTTSRPSRASPRAASGATWSRRCCVRPICGTCARRPSAGSPAACGSGSASRSRCSGVPGSSSWTSRPRGSIPTERRRFLNLLGEIGARRDRDPLHPHRGGRERAVQPHGDHRPGPGRAHRRPGPGHRGAARPGLAQRRRPRRAGGRPSGCTT